MLTGTGDRIAAGLLFALIIGTTFLQKFAVPVGGGNQIFVCFIILIGAAGFGFISGRLELHKTRTTAYLAMIGLMTLTQLLGQHDFSIPSLLLLILIHAPYAFGLKPSSVDPGQELLFYQKTMFILAVLGTLQYVLQFIIGADYAFFLDRGIFPKEFVINSMNNMNPLGYGGTTYKTNGFFLIEASLFCQFLAIAIVIETVYFKNIKRMIAYLLAIALTFSGTGLVILFALLPIYLLQQRRIFLLSALIISIISAPLWAPMIGLGYTVERTTEISATHSSAYARFVSSVPQIKAYILPHTDRTLFGLGAGSMFVSERGKSFDFESALSTWGKVFFEYGLVGFMAYFSFIALIFFSSHRSGYLKSALLIQFIFLGEFLLPAYVHPLILALLVWPTEDLRSKEVKPA